jgi:antitoxin component YwqK of YwqJK toxin-antitoxin module
MKNQYNSQRLREGYWEEYYDNESSLWRKGNYINGEYHGYWELYYYNGKLMSKGNYNNGIQVGIWEYYDKIKTYKKEYYLVD